MSAPSLAAPLIPAARRLLLVSSSRVHGGGYLDHAEAAITARLAGVGRVLFVPFALHDHHVYAETARARFAAMGFLLDSLHEAPDPLVAIAEAEAIFVGGGNTFRLLARLARGGLLAAIRARADGGMPSIGASAGTNLACPTIRTTNDMPIVEPPSLDALGLVPFQINPHYLDPDPASTHMGETRAERIAQYHEDNDLPVVGLREGAMLRVDAGEVHLEGGAGARVFRRGEEPFEAVVGQRLG